MRHYHSKSLEMGGDRKEYLKVYPWHGARENGEILLVKEVIYSSLNREIRPLKSKCFLEGDIGHKVGRELTCEGYVVG